MTGAPIGTSVPFEMPYDSEAVVVLAMWRDIEQQLSMVGRETDEAARLVDEWARLRTEHKRLVELAVRHHRPMPPKWPED
jgi:hypothetical protein